MLIEQEVVRRGLQLMKLTHPAEAALTSALLETLDYEKSVLRDPNQLRVMVFTLGKKLSTQGKKGLISWNAWLLQFVKDGALSEEQAADFKRQAEEIRR